MGMEIQILRNCLYPTNKIHSSMPSVWAKTPHRIYMFNTPEMHRRFLSYHYCRIQRPISIFFTNNSIAAFGGLFTFMLQLFQRGKALSTYLYFDTKLYKYFESNWTRLGRRILQLSYADLFTRQHRLGFKKLEQFIDYCRKPHYWAYRGNLPNDQFKKYTTQTKNASKYLFEDQDGETYYKDQIMQIRYFSIPDSFNQGFQFLNYICIPNKCPPRLDKQIIDKYKIDHLKTIQLLETGQTTINYEQQVKTIKLQQIKTEQGDQPSFMILHYRGLEDFKKLINNPYFQKHYSKINENQNGFNSVIHIIAGQSCQFLAESQFKRFLQKLGNKVKHVIDHPSVTDQKQIQIKFPRHFQLSQQINKYVPQYMPNLKQIYFQYIAAHPYLHIDKLYSDYLLYAARNLYQVRLLPVRYQGYYPIEDNRTDQQQKSIIKTIPDISTLPENTINKQFSQFDPRVTFLGTSSMISTAYRNVSGILIQITDNDYFLFDCGDGIFNQILDHYGQQQIQHALESLKVIFITHLHADHCTGILKLIQQRNILSEKKQLDPLYLIIPSNTIEWVDKYDKYIKKLSKNCQILFTETICGMTQQQILRANQNTPKRYKSVFKNACPAKNKQTNNKLQLNGEQQLQDYYPSSQFKDILFNYTKQQQKHLQKFKRYLEQINLKSFQPVPVIHCPQSYGIVVQHKNNTKVSYSGDCRPTHQFNRIASKSSLLIHEATFLDHQMNSAKTYKHTTVGQAIDVGLKTKSYMTALTHFSVRRTSSKSMKILAPQRYNNFPLKKSYAEQKTFQCFDHLTFRLSEMHNLPKATRFIKSMMTDQNSLNE